MRNVHCGDHGDTSSLESCRLDYCPYELNAVPPCPDIE
jgi:hypothetical protein